MNFYSNLLGATITGKCQQYKIVAVWELNGKVRVLGANKRGEQFLTDLPSDEWNVWVAGVNLSTEDHDTNWETTIF